MTPPTLASERATVQDPLVKYGVEIGWEYLSPGQALGYRKGETGTLLYPVLREKLISLNPGVVTIENVEQVIGRIEGVRNNIEGNAEVLAWMRGERTVFVESEKRQRNVAVIDFDHPHNNTFHVTDEWRYTNGLHSWDKKTNRPDVIFVINGVPVAIVETKSARKPDGIDDAVTQIRRYHAETPEMLTATQVFDVTHLIDFYYGVTWNLDRKNIFNWKDEEKGSFEKKVKRFFARERFLKLLRDWIIFYKKDDELQKAILRQHQARAVSKVLERILDPAKKTGLIWHTQGSGKTFTMIESARHILGHPAMEKPTVIMLVDRNELEGQLSGWIATILGEEKAELATSKRRLRELLRDDYRGLIISMIHKFDKADANLCIRETVAILVDEAHRTTGGDLGNYLVAALPKATMIGFTGTPIDKTAYGKGTFKIFGKDDEKGYLDKYSIAESIEDGTTLPLNYTLAPNEIRVPEELLEEEFFKLAETEGISDIEELNKILDRAVRLKTFLKAADRIEQVAKFAADHFRKNVEPLGYKAFLVGVDREACALYKKALDKLLPPEYSEVVYTSAHNDPAHLAKHRLKGDEEKQIRKAFLKADAMPKILIVTEKLLTGFDAPILYCMYLDKPMRDHTLLQAIARVNRPYEEEGDIRKPCGFVLDFVGIFEKLEKALAFDSDVVASVIRNLDVLKTRFAALMKDRAPAYLELCKGPINDKTVERAIEAFADKEKREAFYRFFKEIETLYEIISPDVFMRDFIEDYGKLSILFQIIRNNFKKRVVLGKDLMRKTEELVKKTAKATGLSMTLPLVKIDKETIESLKKGKASNTSKVINLARALLQTVALEGENHPFLVSIGDRAESILEQFDNRQLATEEALKELEKLVVESVRAREEFEKTGLDINTFSIYWILSHARVKSADKSAKEIDSLFNHYPDYSHNVEDLRLLKAELYKVLLTIVGKDRMVEIADTLLRLNRK